MYSKLTEMIRKKTGEMPRATVSDATPQTVTMNNAVPNRDVVISVEDTDVFGEKSGSVTESENTLIRDVLIDPFECGAKVDGREGIPLDECPLPHRTLCAYRLERELVKASKYYVSGVPVVKREYTCEHCQECNGLKGTAYKTKFPTRAELHLHFVACHLKEAQWRDHCHCGDYVLIGDSHVDCEFANTRCGVCNYIYADCDSLLMHIANVHKDMACSWNFTKTLVPTDPVTAASVFVSGHCPQYQLPCREKTTPLPTVDSAVDHYPLDYFRRNAFWTIGTTNDRLVAQERYQEHEDSDVEELFIENAEPDIPPIVHEVDFVHEGYGFFHELYDQRACTVSTSDLEMFLPEIDRPTLTIAEIVRMCSDLQPFVAALIALAIKDAVNVAQVRTTIYAHMQTRQLVNLARNAATMRKIFKQLMLEERYWEKGSQFIRLSKALNLTKIPVFSSSEHLLELPIPTDDGMRTLIIGVGDCDDKWRQKCVARTVLRSQGLFDFNLTHRIDSDIGQRISEFLERCSTTLEKVGVAVSTIQKFSSLGLKLIAASIAKFDWKVCAILALDFLMTFGLPKEVVKVCLDTIGKAWKSLLALFGFGNVAQAGTETTTCAITALVVTIGSCMLGKFPTGAKLAGMVGGIKLLGDMSRGLTSSWSFLYDMVSRIIDALSTWYYGVPCDITELSKYSSKVVAWYGDVLELTKIDTDKDLKSNPALCNRIATLYRTGLEISIGMRHTPVPKNLLQGFNAHFGQLKDMYKRASNSGAFDTGSRIEPVIIHLSGDSGVGKSGLTPFIAAMICSIDGVGKDENGDPDVFREMYFRSVTQEFWDGYCGQKVVVYDDFGQKVDSPSTPNLEFDEIIRTGNLARFPLHMADLADKDNTNFVSRAVICTSNQAPANLQIRSLNTPQAVKRRLEHCYALSIDEEVSTPVMYENVMKQRLDPKKVRDIYGKSKTTEFYRFHKINPETNTVDPVFIRFPAFMKRIKDAYQAKADDYSQTKEWILEAVAGGIVDNAFDPRQPPPPLPPADIDDEEDVVFHDAAMQVHEAMDFLGFDHKKEEAETDTYSKEALQKYFAEAGPHEWTLGVDTFCLTDEARQILRDLDQLTDDDDDSLFDDILERWEKLPVVVLDNCLDGMVDNSRYRTRFMEAGLIKTNYCAKMARSIRCAMASVKSWFSKMLTKMTKHIDENMKWYFGFAALSIVVGLYKYDKYEKLVLEKPTHATLKSESTHAHACEACGKLCSHTHGPVGPEDALTSILLCADCAKGCAVSFYGDKETCKFVCHFANGRNVTIDKTADLEYYLENINSCDKVTTTSTIIEEYAEHMSELKSISAQSLRLEGRKVISLKTQGKWNRPQKVVMELYGGATAEAGTASAGPPTRRRQRDTRVQERNVTESVKAEMANDNASMDISVKALKNTYLISAITPTGSRHTTRGIFIKGRIMLTVFHMKRHLIPGNTLHIRNVRVKDGWTVPCADLKTIEVVGPENSFLDQILIEFPKSVTQHCDLTGMIADTKTLQSFNEIEAGLCVAVDKDTAVIRTGNAVGKEDVSYLANGPSGEVTLTVRKAYEYKGLQNNEGDCGSPLVAMNSKILKKIIGIHVCGSYGTGYSSALNIAYIEQAMSKNFLTAQISFEPEKHLEYQEELECDDLPPGNFMLLGKVEKFISGPATTKLRPSLMHNLISPATMAPAKLGPFILDGRMVDPMSSSLAKAGTTPPTLDEGILDIATKAVSTVVNSFDSSEYARVLTDEECIQGCGEHFVPVNRRTSAGYPWILSTDGKPGKTKWLGNDEYTYHAELKAAVDLRIENAKKGIRMPAVWVDTLKDEKRPMEKVRVGKTRTISAGPQDFLLAFRKYFGGFTAHVVKHRIHNEISVGVDMHSPAEVKKLRDHVLSRGDKVIAGDFSNFDGTLCPQVLYRALEVVEDFYDGSEEDRLVRAVLFEEIVNSVHLKRNVLYMWTHSQPSGNPLTSYFNSLYNSISLRYVWMKIAPEGQRNMIAFHKNVAVQSYGDDNLVGVSRECDFYNQVAITEGYTHLNMVYTMESKTGDVIPFRDLSQVSYLKRTFRQNEDGLWVAPLDLSVILEMGQWVHGDIDSQSLCVANCATALEELVLHGRETYDAEAIKFRRAARQAKLPLLVPTYEEAYDAWKARSALTVDLDVGASADCRVVLAAKPAPEPGFVPSGEPI